MPWLTRNAGWDLADWNAPLCSPLSFLSPAEKLVRDNGHMKVVPLLWQMRAAVSSDGRIAKFFLTFKGGQHSAFAMPFHKAGLFIKAIRSTIAMMSDRMAAAPKPDAIAEITEGLGHAAERQKY